MRFACLLFLIFLAYLSPFASAADDAAECSTRISRPQAIESSHFNSFVAGLSARWWRKFKNPALCSYVLCAGSCADISATPRLGSFTQDELVSDITPCSLNSQAFSCNSQDCCLSRNVNNACQSNSCQGNSCCEAGADGSVSPSQPK